MNAKTGSLPPISKGLPEKYRKTIMLKVLDSLPGNVLTIEASGKVTHEDYRDTFIPNAEAMMARGPIKFLYIVENNFEGFEIEALWDDGTFGIKHWRQFSHIAVVADQAWLRATISVFKAIIPAEVRLFGLSELSSAKNWIANA
jgi:hypothetical protein